MVCHAAVVVTKLAVTVADVIAVFFVAVAIVASQQCGHCVLAMSLSQCFCLLRPAVAIAGH